MDSISFLQHIGATFAGCALFALSAYGYWTIHKKEKEGGSIRDVSGWTLFFCVLGPLLTAVAAYSVK